MSYKQYMKHWKNHRKDKYCQQCSGYSGESLEDLMVEYKKANQVIAYLILDDRGTVIDKAQSYEGIVNKAQSIENKEICMIAMLLANGKIKFMGRASLCHL